MFEPAGLVTLQVVPVLRALFHESVGRLHNHELGGQLLAALEKVEAQSLRQMFDEIDRSNKIKRSESAALIDEPVTGDISQKEVIQKVLRPCVRKRLGGSIDAKRPDLWAKSRERRVLATAQVNGPSHLAVFDQPPDPFFCRRLEEPTRESPSPRQGRSALLIKVVCHALQGQQRSLIKLRRVSQVARPRAISDRVRNPRLRAPKPLVEAREQVDGKRSLAGQFAVKSVYSALDGAGAKSAWLI